jgi:1-deoxy-D-xylulose-5-phosphate reductoisomerase
MDAADAYGAEIIPVDSEHSAIFQCLQGCRDHGEIRRLLLTCSGGPFFGKSFAELESMTREDALRHPNWTMGAKITIDCATLVNKAFEVIEARWLYNARFSDIDVIIHRQSIIHSMVEFNDGSVIAQLSYPSMELPIALALSYPERITSPVKSLDFAQLKTLTFEELDHDRFPCFDLVLMAGKQGGTYPAVANASSEMAVKLFLEGKIGFNDIYKAMYGALLSHDGGHHVDLEHLCEADAFARQYVKELFSK